jgi:tRNA1Val (adenine37-N6)-methyltransferase
MPELTLDTFFGGRLEVRQSRTGYRFSIDPVLLAHHVRPKPGSRLVDLGTGCGILPLILAFRFPQIQVYGVELQPQLAALARQNARANGFVEAIRILTADLRGLSAATFDGPVDVVLTNPPYRRAASGRVNPNREKAVARHEVAVTLDECLATAGALLGKGGAFWVVYPAERLVDLVCGSRGVGIEPKYLRLIQSHPHAEAHRLLLGGIKGARPGIRVAAPLCIYDRQGAYSPEVARMFAP